MMVKCGIAGLLGLALIVLSGCESLPEDGPASSLPPGDQIAGTTGYDGDDGFGGQAIGTTDMSQGSGAPVEGVIYFEFDSNAVASEYLDVVKAHARYLLNNPDVVLSLAGHTDERGSREYNIGLAERRSKSVRRMLIIQGVSAGQLRTVSYGEEKPAAFGGDERAWSMNRRVEFSYGG